MKSRFRRRSGAVSPHAFNRRNGHLQRVVLIERLQPGANAHPHWLNLYAAIDGRKSIEAPQGGAQQRRSTDPVLSLEMVKGGCHLNQSLQERLLRLRTLQPDAFPVLVRQEKLLAPVASQAFRKCAATPVERHGSQIIIRDEGRIAAASGQGAHESH